MENRPAEELKQIASDLFRGGIFTDRHVTNPNDLLKVFMPLALMKPSRMRKLQKDPPGMIFEYLDKAGPRDINGMPGFFSCQMLSREDAKKVLELYSKLKEVEEEVLK